MEGGGPSGQAGAIRLAMSKGLAAFSDEHTVEKMRIGKNTLNLSNGF